MRIKNLEPRLGEIGKIKIGGLNPEKRKNRTGDGFHQLPVRYDHFVITHCHRGPDGNLVPNDEIMKLIGDKCKDLEILLLYNDPELNFPTSYAWYDGKKRMCQGDGATAQRRGAKDGKANGTFSTIACPCEKLEKDEKGGSLCKPYGILSVMLPQIDQIGGVFTFRTHGWNSVTAIMSSLELLANLTRGHIAMIPKLKLVLKPIAGEHGDVFVANIVFTGKLSDLYDAAFKVRELEAGQETRLMLLEKNASSAAEQMMRNEDPAEEAVIAEEFYPAADGTPCDTETGEVIEDQQKQKEEPAEDPRIVRLRGLWIRTRDEIVFTQPEFLEFLGQWGCKKSEDAASLTDAQLDRWEECLTAVKDGQTTKDRILADLRKAQAQPEAEPMDADFTVQPEATPVPEQVRPAAAATAVQQEMFPAANPTTTTNGNGRRKAPVGI